jgi:Carboxyl transferase domain/Malonate decarboxylase gamma subunit (MdcE)
LNATSPSPPPSLADALRKALSVQPVGSASGNLTVYRGSLDGHAVHVAFIENRIASGSIGALEAKKLASLFKIAALSKASIVLYLDSAGARISEGLQALGAFRLLFKEGVAAAAVGAPIAVALGRNCFGGASMVAHLAKRRLFSPTSQLAMSGPSILAQAAGVSALDDMFRAIAETTIAAPARVQANDANSMWTPGMDLTAWLREAMVPVAQTWNTFYARHQALAARIKDAPPAQVPVPTTRKDLEKLFPDGYRASEDAGILTGDARRNTTSAPLLGLVGNSPLSCARAWRFAEALWQNARAPTARLEVLLDCESHAPRIEDEKIVLTEFIVDVGLALGAIAARGTFIDLTILGRAGGGVYVAIAAFASRISVVYGADIQVLPGSAIASILGENREAVGSIEEYRSAQVADEELRLGLVP